MFRDIGNADEKMKAVTKTAEEALRRIRNESPINARRVKSYGISVGTDEAGEPQRAATEYSTTRTPPPMQTPPYGGALRYPSSPLPYRSF